MQRHSQSRLAVVTTVLSTALAILLTTSPAPSQGTIILVTRAVELIASLASAVDAYNSKGWNDGATEKLDQLVNMSVGITEELKELNILLSKKPKEDFPDYIKDLKADIKQFGAYELRLKKYQTLTEAEKTGLQDFSVLLDRDVFRSCDYGAAAYETTFTATIVVRAVYKYLGRSSDGQKPFFSSVDDCFKTWLDASKDDSPVKLKNDEGKQVEGLAKQLADIEKSNSARQAVDKYWYKTKDAYELHKKSETRLEEVASQLESYHQALSDVIKGGRLLIKGAEHLR